MAADAAHQDWKPQANPWLIAATVALAAFMEVLDTSIANVALPHIAGNLGASTDQGTWVLTSYLVANAIILPVGGWASSVLGRRNFFMMCIVIFTISSFLCGIAPSLPILLICRVFQGIGGGGLQPMAQAIMADSFEEKKRGQAFALYGLVAVLAPSVGPTIGGWITDNYSWRWIFYINIPVGILAFVLTSRLVQDPPWIKADRKNFFKLDYIGLALLTMAMGGLQIALDKGEENDWFQSRFICFFAAMFVVGIVGLIWWEWKHKNPIMNLKLFKFKNFAICCLLMMLVGGVLNAATVLQPQFLQQLLGYTATNAGMALTAGGIALVIVMPMAGIATGKFAARNLAALGFTFFAIAYYYVSTHITLDMSFGEASFLRVIQMIPIPFCFIAITNAAYVGLPKEASNQVSGLINFVRNVGGSIFIAVTGALVTNRSLFHQERLAESMQNGSKAYAGTIGSLSTMFGGGAGGTTMAQATVYQQLNQQASAMGYQDIYRMLCWMSCAMVCCAFLLSKNKPGQGAPAGEAVH
ncbi:MFS transporter, DHA2 family, multidrug resistance protein [Granulicella pectinivorans]|uniref:MFS transporter, DHA2 family, multidrug resistance protein n=1 Tax=Granulicella pectinivorans TaxID=474950 RepID=A0A1I6M4H8_9BACT|nr:DHA2 family efflux MFS transporter permease subunit [Granulicella pectinivorans]SFS10574.1 MFS transporter, DHA2 family, multidrug resistance protein [Granulicella pectinivorans]